jgi:hypothetical protein
MSINNNSSFKKCHKCGQMSKWNLADDDRCDHCNAFLVSRELIQKRQKSIEEESQDIIIRWEFTKVFEKDSMLIRFFKSVAWKIQIILTAILSFFVWLIATLAG